MFMIFLLKPRKKWIIYVIPKDDSYWNGIYLVILVISRIRRTVNANFLTPVLGSANEEEDKDDHHEEVMMLLNSKHSVNKLIFGEPERTRVATSGAKNDIRLDTKDAFWVSGVDTRNRGRFRTKPSF